MTTILKIRAHHLLCMQGYQGYGYSRSFKEHFESICQLIRNQPDIEMLLVADNDIICEKCPNAVDNYCQSFSQSLKIERMDLKVLEKMGLVAGTKSTASELFTRVNQYLQTRSDIEGICDSCQWQQKCLWYLSRL